MTSSSKKTKVPGIYKRGDGYAYVLSLPRDPETRRRQQKWIGGFHTLAEAKSARTRDFAKMDQGNYVPPSNITLTQFVEDQWLPVQATRVRPGTANLYQINWHRVKPRIGHLPIRSVDPGKLQVLYSELLAGGGREGQPLGARSVQIVHAFLHRCLADAVRWEILGRNPAELVDRPTAPRPEIKSWTPDDVRAFLKFVAEDRLAPLWRLVATTGLRRGELLGLRWNDVDLDGSRIAVQQSLVLVKGVPTISEPKTSNARRSIDLDPETVVQLRRWKLRLAKEKLKAADIWSESGLVFVDELGGPLHPSTVTRTFSRLAASAELPPIKLHGLRHSHATAMLAAGVSPKVAQERLGHFSVSLTLDTYSHTIAGMQSEAACQVASLLDGN